MRVLIPAVALLLLHATTMAQYRQPTGSQQQPQKGRQSQGIGIGIKAGINFPNVNSTSALSTSNTSGFMVGAFYSPGGQRTIMGYRTEFIFSRQGYDYKSNTNTGNVSLSYLLMPQLMTINITKYVQLQAGMQMAFLLNAKADSSDASSGSAQYDQMMKHYKKFNYGFAGGIEIHPFRGILLGARYNFSMGDMFSSTAAANAGPAIFSVDKKNNVLQVFAGYAF